MGNEFEAYIQRLELIGFFSGYPFLYTLILVIAGPVQKRSPVKTRLVAFLPLAYALAGTLYMGYLLKAWYPHYSLSSIKTAIQQSWLIVWGLLSILFWLPLLRKKNYWSFLHSLVFFGLFARDIFLVNQQDTGLLKNNMKVYTDSLLLQLACYFTIVLIYFLFRITRKKSTLN